MARLMAKIGPGDIVVVTRLDRLGRSTRTTRSIQQISGAGPASARPLTASRGPHTRLDTHFACVEQGLRRQIRDRVIWAEACLSKTF